MISQPKAPIVRDIACCCVITDGTVSYVLNGNFPDTFSAIKNRQKQRLRTGAELGYRLNFAAQSTIRCKTLAVGSIEKNMLCSWPGDTYPKTEGTKVRFSN
ncbi:MAG TPA: hypothetical protein P5175_10320 [Anaerohalosphaeraceae bacterium]|nr:hypothetical protein [Phycisphaerae bacterium]HPC64387.1 hypothetical protein [Anaerohalosphaeraceae bacterium]HPO70188.1 hypothetical protein [Anaerohalosphaeraceae bacterium]HRS72230.1 hypothetical protein [Anaerohalosphaeraceae bacterium]